LLLEGEAAAGDVDVVIGRKECDQGDHRAGQGLQQGFGVEAAEGAGCWLGFWRDRDWRHGRERQHCQA
jgi:hypothetical protein